MLQIRNTRQFIYKSARLGLIQAISECLPTIVFASTQEKALAEIDEIYCTADNYAKAVGLDVPKYSYITNWQRRLDITFKLTRISINFLAAAYDQHNKIVFLLEEARVDRAFCLVFIPPLPPEYIDAD